MYLLLLLLLVTFTVFLKQNSRTYYYLFKLYILLLYIIITKAPSSFSPSNKSNKSNKSNVWGNVGAKTETRFIPMSYLIHAFRSKYINIFKSLVCSLSFNNSDCIRKLSLTQSEFIYSSIKCPYLCTRNSSTGVTKPAVIFQWWSKKIQ